MPERIVQPDRDGLANFFSGGSSPLPPLAIRVIHNPQGFPQRFLTL
jgi:hypothetical protein